MNRVAYSAILGLSLTLSVACSGGPRAAAIPFAKPVGPTAASLSTATSVPLATATAAPISTSTAVPPPTATASAVSPASPAKPATPTETPVARQGADWKLYRDQSRGFEFRYPAACTVAQRNESYTVGGRIELTIAGAKGLTLQDYVNQFIDVQMRTNGWKPESRQEVLVGGNEALRIDYRFGGTNRFGTAVFVEQDDKVYIWGLTAGAFTCDEGSAFDGILSSFQFTPENPPISAPTRAPVSVPSRLPSIELSPKAGRGGTEVRVAGSGFPASVGVW